MISGTEVGGGNGDGLRTLSLTISGYSPSDVSNGDEKLISYHRHLRYCQHFSVNQAPPLQPNALAWFVPKLAYLSTLIILEMACTESNVCHLKQKIACSNEPNLV